MKALSWGREHDLALDSSLWSLYAAGIFSTPSSLVNTCERLAFVQLTASLLCWTCGSCQQYLCAHFGKLSSGEISSSGLDPAMEGLEQLDMVGDISPALEATEDFIHCMDGIQGQGPSQAQTGSVQPPRQPKQLQEVSSAALGKLSSSGVWSLLAREQPEVGPLGLAWADNFSVLGLGMGLRHGKRSRARSTNDLAAHTKECTNNTANSSSHSAFKKGHNRSRSDVNYRPSAFTDNGLPAVDCNTLKNMILNHQQEGELTSAVRVWCWEWLLWIYEFKCFRSHETKQAASRCPLLSENIRWYLFSLFYRWNDLLKKKALWKHRP